MMVKLVVFIFILNSSFLRAQYTHTVTKQQRKEESPKNNFNSDNLIEQDVSQTTSRAAELSKLSKADKPAPHTSSVVENTQENLSVGDSFTTEILENQTDISLSEINSNVSSIEEDNLFDLDTSTYEPNGVPIKSPQQQPEKEVNLTVINTTNEANGNNTESFIERDNPFISGANTSVPDARPFKSSQQQPEKQENVTIMNTTNETIDNNTKSEHGNIFNTGLTKISSNSDTKSSTTNKSKEAIVTLDESSENDTNTMIQNTLIVVSVGLVVATVSLLWIKGKRGRREHALEVYHASIST